MCFLFLALFGVFAADVFGMLFCFFLLVLPSREGHASGCRVKLHRMTQQRHRTVVATIDFWNADSDMRICPTELWVLGSSVA